MPKTEDAEAGRPVDLGDYRRLNDPEFRERHEARAGTFIVEGLTAVETLARSSYDIRSVLSTPRHRARVRDAVGPDVPVHLVEPDQMAATVGFDFHRGVVACAERGRQPDAADLLAGADVAVVVEGVNDHENLGAIFRNAAALGADCVILDPTAADPLYRRAVRVSVGNVLRIPWSRMENWPPEWPGSMTAAALTPSGTDRIVDAPPPVAWVIGAEGPGLTSRAQAACHRSVGIPMGSGVDSLNVATALAIALAGSL